MFLDGRTDLNFYVCATQWSVIEEEAINIAGYWNRMCG